MKVLMDQLAERYPQLYIRPSEHAEEDVQRAVRSGEAPLEKELSHFIGSGQDWLRTEDTPAGPVEILYLHERRDFETFVQIIAQRCRPDPIPPSVGAQTFLGLRNWKKIREHQKAYLSSGGTDWPEEIRRFAADKQKSTDTLIVISNGPYSAIPWNRTPYGEEEWLRVSRDIRYYHECAHVICRRMMPDRIRPLWDELTADLTGLRMATGAYNADLASAFLGISRDGYTGGRLIHYLPQEERQSPDKIAAEIWQICQELGAVSAEWPTEQSYELLLHLTREPLLNR